MYTKDHIFPVPPIKDLTNKDVKPTTPFKLETGTEPSVSHLRMLFCSCVVQKATAHVGTKALNMRHQSQKGFRGIFVGITQHQKVYLAYVQQKRKIIYSYDVVPDESFSSAFAYTSQPYVETVDMCLAVSYTPCATSSRGQTINIITVAHFEKAN